MVYLIASLLMLLAGCSITLYKKEWLLFLYDRVNKKWRGKFDARKFNHQVGYLYLYNACLFFIMFMALILTNYSEDTITTVGDSFLVVTDILLIFYIWKSTRLKNEQ